MTKVYRPTPKALGKGALEPTDRFIFTGPMEAVCFNDETRVIIEPFMLKSIDCHVQEDTKPFVPNLILTDSLKREYTKEQLDPITKLNILS
jgi:hypothetical protein